MLRSMLLNSFRPFYAPPDDLIPAAVDSDPAEPVIKPDVEPAATDTEPEPKIPASAADPKPVAAQAEIWQDKELKRKHRQIQEEKRRNLELQAQLDDAQALLARAAGGTADTPQSPPPPPAPTVDTVPRSEVENVARQIVAQKDFNQQCNDVEKAGKAAYKDEWPKVAETLTTLGGFTQEEMQGVLATDDPAKVLYELGKNPDKYHELKELPPAKRLAAMVKMAITEVKPVAKPSEAPEPVVPVGGRGGAAVAELDDKLSDDDWHRQRDAQRLKRMAVRNGNSLRA